MAFDGITIANIAQELNQTIVGGKINKIAQPENDELMITIKNNRTVYRLLLSASASLPLIYLTDNNKPGPMTAPNFCMLLRKHIGSARILSVTQPGLERILIFELEHLNELGDICRKKLIVEIMGKHSNLIFCQEDNTILDSIKHISANMSSVREVLPGRTWFIPHTQDKKDPLTITEEEFFDFVCTKPMAAAKAIYTSLTGFSPLMAEEVCCRAGIDGGFAVNALEENAKLHLFRTFSYLIEDIKNGAHISKPVNGSYDDIVYSYYQVEDGADVHLSTDESYQTTAEEDGTVYISDDTTDAYTTIEHYISDEELYSKYEKYGLTYRDGRLYYNGEAVKYFDDTVAVDDTITEIIAYLDSDGTVALTAEREGSDSGLGELTGIRVVPEEEYITVNTGFVS